MANVKAFAEDAPSGKRTVFNETTQSDDITTNLNNSYTRGWEVIGDNAPSIQDINAVGYTQGYLISYLYQQGVPEWSSEQGYMKHNMVNFEGKIYSCKIGDETNRCYNKNPKTEIGYWREIGLEDRISESNLGSSFLAKLSKSIDTRDIYSYYKNNKNIHREYYNTIRTRSNKGFSNTIEGYFYCPDKGVYFLKGSIIIKTVRNIYPTLSDSEVDGVNDNKIIIFKNIEPEIETKFSVLRYENSTLTYSITVSGLVELDKGDYVAFGCNFSLNGHILSNDVSIIDGSFMGYKI